MTIQVEVTLINRLSQNLRLGCGSGGGVGCMLFARLVGRSLIPWAEVSSDKKLPFMLLFDQQTDTASPMCACGWMNVVKHLGMNKSAWLGEWDL